MERSEIMVEKVGKRPVTFSATCPECGHTEDAVSHSRTERDKAEMDMIAERSAVSKIVVHLKIVHDIEVE